MKQKDFLLSVVCPITDVSEAVVFYLSNLLKEVSQIYEQYELILVQDGNCLPSESEIMRFVKESEGIRLLKLIQNLGVDVCITAGLESAIGDVVVVCLPPFDPSDKISEFVAAARAGFIGVGQRPFGHHEFFIKTWLKGLFYHFANGVLGLGLPSDTTYFVSLPRQAVSQIQRAGDRFRFLKVITAQTGIPHKLIKYCPVEKDGRVYRSFWDSIKLSIDVVTSQSLLPLRFASILSAFVSVCSFAYIIYVLNIWLFKDVVQPGWGTLSVFIAAGFSLFGIVFSLICEYLAKLFDESRNRPIYSISDEVVSNRVIANVHSVNVLSSSKSE